MQLEVVKYGTPVLRKKGNRIEQVTAETRQLIADMLETMEAYHGVGLAAQQIGQALQLTVIDVSEVKDRPSWTEVNGKRVDVASFMPLVLINPQVTPVGDPETGPEGCLSFPDLYADITRPGVVDVKAWDEEGKPLQFRCGGLLARAVQHEVDHLNGILFIDRMAAKDKAAMQEDLDALQADTKAALARR